MKTIRTLAAVTVFIAVCIAQQAQAKIWRVNNRSNYNGTTLWGNNFGGTVAFPVFKQINQVVAWNTVNDFDTVHVEGSPNFYDAATITKRLVIIGPGYFLDNNPNTSNDLFDAKVRAISFSAGSDGSVLSGINVAVATNVNDGYVTIIGDSITVKRCKIDRAIYFSITGAGLINYLAIVENYFPDTYATNAFSVTNTGYIPPVDIIFNNNICKKTLYWQNTSGTVVWSITQCRNNIFDGPDNLATPNLRFSTTDFSNNILMPVNAVVDITANPGAISHNIGTQSTQFGTANNNLVEPAITSLFGGGASADGYYQIQPGSQAYQNGSDGSDRGAFGGAIVSSRYTLSGLAPVPVLYEATSTGVASPVTGLPVTIKARTIK